jgi:hypothetical protein
MTNELRTCNNPMCKHRGNEFCSTNDCCPACHKKGKLVKGYYTDCNRLKAVQLRYKELFEQIDRDNMP